jgi:hypothetical protein
MAMTYVARIKGEFVGAPTELFYFIALGLVSFRFLYLDTISLGIENIFN